MLVCLPVDPELRPFDELLEGCEALPGIISTALFTVLLAYNEFILVLVLTQSKWTLPVAIAQFTGGEDPGYITLASAAAVSATIPIVILIIFFQKQLVKGLAAGAVKG